MIVSRGFFNFSEFIFTLEKKKKKTEQEQK